MVNMIRANLLGCGIFIVGLILGGFILTIAERTLGFESSQLLATTAIMGPIAAIDLAYRLSQGDAGSIGEPEKGGHIGCPLWIIAAVIWAVAAFNTMFGTNIR